MGVRVEVRVRPWRVTAAISAACLTVMAAGCGGSASTALPGVAVSTTPAATSATTPARAATRTATPAATPAPTAVDTRIKVYGNCTTPSVEPTEIVVTCGDYGTVLEGLRWTSWTAASATAVGTLVYKDCKPDCADGHFHHVPGTRVTLTVPVSGAGGQVVWSRIQEYPEPPGYETGPLHGLPQPLPKGPI